MINEYPYLGVDTRVALLSTSFAPGHDTLQLPVAHNRTTTVTLRVREKII